MRLTRWEPFGSMWKEVNRLQREMNHLFGPYGLSGDGWPGLAGSFPALNIWQDEGSVYAEAELPGMELNDLEIFVTGGNQLTHTGEGEQPKHAQRTLQCQQRGCGSLPPVVE